MALMPEVPDRPVRQRHRQVDVVDHGFRQHLHRFLRGLPAVLRLAEDRRHLRAGIGGRDRDLRQVGPERDRLGETDGRAAAERHQAIGAGALRPRPARPP